MVKIEDIGPFAIILVIVTIVLMAGSNILDSMHTQFSDTTSVSEEEFAGVAATAHALTYMKITDGSESLYNQTNDTEVNSTIDVGNCSFAVNGTHTFGNLNDRYAKNGGNAIITVVYVYNSTCQVLVEGAVVGVLDGASPDTFTLAETNFSGTISVVYNSTAGGTNITRTDLNYLYFQAEASDGYTMDYYNGDVTPVSSDNYSIDYTYYSSTYASNATKAGMLGVEKVSDWLPTIGMIVAAAIVVGIVMTSFS